ncbi:MAG: NAD(P)/FAD-dependent oxidoreductase [Acidobacteriaceae bacterium]|nr:NAD(P)/FAD-dependent oxidoreductase [Acidobacteriaceae bacterium]
MAKHKRHELGDEALGLNTPIDRRDLLNSTLLAGGAILLGGLSPLELLSKDDWTGYGGVGDYADSNGNTYEVMTAGHQIRDRVFEHGAHRPLDTGEEFDCVVVGGGISGLASALFYTRRSDTSRTCLVLDDHPIFGGEAKRNEFEVDGERLMIHQGSAACFPPLPQTFLAEFYDSIGLKWDEFKYQDWGGPQPSMRLQTAPYPVGGPTSGFFFGAKFGHPEGIWLIDPWGKQLQGAPIPQQAQKELLRMRDIDRKPFSTHPHQPKTNGDAASRYLDTITLEQHLIETYGLSRDTVRTYLSPISGGGSGLGPDVLSAYCEYAADVLLPWQYDKGAQMFPGGNAGVARQILRQLIPNSIAGADTMSGICRGNVNFGALDRANQRARIRLGATVVSVAHNGDPAHASSIDILYTENGKLYRIKARSAILAGGGWTTKHVVRDMPAVCREAYLQFYRAPCLMANVAVRNWRFLYNLGLTECQWFEGFGNYITLRKVATLGTDPATINPDKPTVINLKVLFSRPGLSLQEQTVRGRTELFSTPFRTYERLIREQFTVMFERAGFNASRDIAGIILNRWGHAYLSPQPGFFFGKDGKGGPGDTIRNHPYGRVAFANSDLSGIMDHRMSILEARRAVEQVMAQST